MHSIMLVLLFGLLFGSCDSRIRDDSSIKEIQVAGQSECKKDGSWPFAAWTYTSKFGDGTGNTLNISWRYDLIMYSGNDGALIQENLYYIQRDPFDSGGRSMDRFNFKYHAIAKMTEDEIIQYEKKYPKYEIRSMRAVISTTPIGDFWSPTGDMLLRDNNCLFIPNAISSQCLTQFGKIRDMIQSCE